MLRDENFPPSSQAQFQSIAFGLRIQSNVGIPGLPPCEFEKPPDVSCHFGSIPERFAATSETLRPIIRYWEGEATLFVGVPKDRSYLRFQYKDGTQFVVDGESRNVWASWPETLSLEDTATYFLGPMIGYLLRQRGVVCLHSAAVAIGEEAFTVVGLPGAGKSTLAATFARLGFPVLGDDIIPLVENADVISAGPSYPRIRLWDSSVTKLFGSASALPLLTPTWEKRFLSINSPEYTFQREPLPLKAVFVLGDRLSDAGFQIKPLSARESLMAIVTNTYSNYLLSENQRAEEFRFAARLVKKVPVISLRLGGGVSAMIKNCNSLASSFRELETLREHTVEAHA